MKYISTRGETEPLSFQDTVLTGLAPDGGLLIPERIPDVKDQLESWSTLSFQDITFQILRLFVDIPENDLRELIKKSYQTFRHPAIAPAIPVGSLYILELFHGPTLAFKDVAMQFLSHIFEYILEKRDQHLNILGSTSGDTGSAAIHGVRGMDRINIFMMHPDGRTSPLQKKQMTSVLDQNVFNMAIKGTFDDCQHIMKSIFQDINFKEKYELGAVNSVNWCRVLVQIVYYFSAGLHVLKQTDSPTIQFCVPTGNFGNILAGYYAMRMGLPISRLILATNENDILSRFFQTGKYTIGKVKKTLSPSMDIQVASNFERYLYYLLGEDSAQVVRCMQDFNETGTIILPLGNGEYFRSSCGDREKTIATIKKYYDEHKYMLDPHTAVGVYVGERLRDKEEPCICLATAHPAKFGEAIFEATGQNPFHEMLDKLKVSKTHCITLPAEEDRIRNYIRESVTRN